MKTQHNYRIYDRTGCGVTEDITADDIDDAITQGREWVEDGDWSNDSDNNDSDNNDSDNNDSDNNDSDAIAVCRTITLDACVREIVYAPDLSEIEALPGVIDVEVLPDGNVKVDMDSDFCSTLPGTIVDMSAKDEDGYHDAVITLPEDWPMIIDEGATNDNESHDCSGSYTDDEPDCPIDEGWDFVSTVTADMDEFGCRSHGGTAMTNYEVCRNTGVYRDTLDKGSQVNCDEATEIITYRERDERSTKWVKEQHEENGYLPEWLAEYLGEEGSTKSAIAEVVGDLQNEAQDVSQGIWTEIEESDLDSMSLDDANEWIADLRERIESAKED